MSTNTPKIETSIEELWNKAERIELNQRGENGTYKVIFTVGTETFEKDNVHSRVLTSLKAKNYKRIYFAKDAKLTTSSYAPHYEEFTPPVKPFGAIVIGVIAAVPETSKTPAPTDTSSPTTTSPSTLQAQTTKKLRSISAEESKNVVSNKTDRGRPVVYKTLSHPVSTDS